nr:DUF2335 domain-containing protein [Providencia rettgeri]
MMSSEQEQDKHHTIISEEELTGAVAKIESAAEENPDVLERLLDRPKIMSVIQKREIFHGPLPHPDHLRQYEEIAPGMAERILSFTEAEQRFRHETQKTALNGAIRKDKRGQWMAYSLSLLIFLLGGYLMWKGEHGTGAGLITMNVIGLAGVFVFGRKAKQPTPDDE